MANDITVIVGPSGTAGKQVRSILQRLRTLGVCTKVSSLFWIDELDIRWQLNDESQWRVTTSMQDDLALLRCESATFIVVELAESALLAFDAGFEPSHAIGLTHEIKFPPGMVASQFRLVAPTSHEDRFDATTLPGWSTVVAAPENRFSDRHSPASLKTEVESKPGDYFGHVAAHIATIAGLWRNDAGDLFGGDFAPVQEGSAIVQRVFSRSVVGADVSNGIVEPLLDQQSGVWPVPRTVDRSVDLVPHPAPHELVAEAVRELGNVEGFRYKRPSAYSPPTATRISIGDAFRIFFARIRGGAIDAPSVVSSAAKQRLAASAHQLTTTITGLGGKGSKVTFSSSALQDGDFGSAAQILDRIGAPVFVQATPAAWRTLRSMCFGLIDGDRNSAADELALVEGRRTAVTSPSLIAPVLDSPGVDDAAAGSFLSATSPSPDNLVPQSGSQSLLGQLDDAISGERERAAGDSDYALRILAEAPETSEVTERAERRLDQLRSKARMIGLGMLVGMAYAVFTTIGDIRNGSFAIGVSPAEMTVASWVTVAVVAVFLLTVVWYVREELRIRFQLDEHYRRIEWAEKSLPAALTEMHRLDAIDEQFCDWALVIQNVVHRPWGSDATVQRELASDVFDEHELPHSLLVVHGGSDSSAESNLRLGLEAELVRVGWLGQIYDEVSTEALEEFAHENRRVNDDRMDPDEDVPTAPNGTRMWLAEQFSSGRGQELARRRARGLAVTYLLGLDPNETLPRLQAGWHPATLLDGLSTSDLLSELRDADQTPLDQSIFTPAGQQRGAREVLVRSSFVPAPLRIGVAGPDVRNGSTDFTLVSTRVELSGATPNGDFTLFEEQLEHPEPSSKAKRKKRSGQARPAQIEEPLI